MPSFENLNNAKGLQALNDYLESRSYISGYSASAEDARTFALVSNNIHRADYPHVARWASHIAALIAAHKLQPVFVEVEEKEEPAAEEEAAAEEAAAEEAKEEAGGDDVFSFDDDGGDDDAAALIAKKKKEEEDKKKKAAKERPPAKSTVVMDVKPLEEDTDLGQLEAQIKAITKEGLVWGAKCERVPVAYGIFNLRVLCTIVDDLLVSTIWNRKFKRLTACKRPIFSRSTRCERAASF